MNARKRYLSFSVSEKKKIIAAVERGSKKRCREKLQYSTIHTVYNSRKKKQRFWEANCMTSSSGPLLEDFSIKYFRQRRCQKLPVGGPLLKSKPLECALGIFDFKAGERCWPISKPDMTFVLKNYASDNEDALNGKSN